MRKLKLLGLVATVAFATAALTLSAGANAATKANAATTPAVRVDYSYVMIIRVLNDAAGKYQVEIDNENPTRFVSAFNWTPPSGLTVTAVTSSIGGMCHLNGGIIGCTGLALPAPSSTSMGGALIVNFTATGLQPTWTGSYFIHYGVVGTVQVQLSNFSDLPLCKKGHSSTRAHPCAKS